MNKSAKIKVSNEDALTLHCFWHNKNLDERLKMKEINSSDVTEAIIQSMWTPFPGKKAYATKITNLYRKQLEKEGKNANRSIASCKAHATKVVIRGHY